MILYIIATPFLILLSFKSKYRQSLPARFFLFKNPPFSKRGIWFHVASLGEVKSLKPLVDRLEGEKNISMITQTGFEEAGKLNAHRRYLPFEILLPLWIGKQRALVVSEAELWYLLFFIAKRRGLKTYLINARISDRSYKNYQRFRWFYQKIFANIDHVFAQSEKDKRRLEALGAQNITVNGNIKAFQKIEVTTKYQKPLVPVITLASTHNGEEELILSYLKRENQKIIVVPRHPERFDEVDHFLQRYAADKRLSYHRFSESEDFESDVILVDKMGELINIYAISDTVILGGSFVKGIGGHNPLEPAHFGCKIVSGRHIFNQQVLFSLVDGIKLVELDALAAIVPTLKKCEIVSSVEIEPILKALRSS